MNCHTANDYVSHQVRREVVAHKNDFPVAHAEDLYHRHDLDPFGSVEGGVILDDEHVRVGGSVHHCSPPEADTRRNPHPPPGLERPHRITTKVE